MNKNHKLYKNEKINVACMQVFPPLRIYTIPHPLSCSTEGWSLDQIPYLLVLTAIGTRKCMKSYIHIKKQAKHMQQVISVD